MSNYQSALEKAKKHLSVNMYKPRPKKPIKSVIVKEINKVLGKKVEKKFYDVNNAGSITNAPAISNLTLVPQGTTDLTRVGDKLTTRNLQYKNMIDVESLGPYNRVRLTLIRWNRDTNVVLPSASTVYQNIGAHLMSPFNFDSLRKGDFTILYDKVFNLVYQNDSAIKSISIKKKLGHAINFVASGTAGEGHIFSLLTSDSGVATHPTFQEYSRLVFTDM